MCASETVVAFRTRNGRRHCVDCLIAVGWSLLRDRPPHRTIRHFLTANALVSYLEYVTPNR